MPCTASFALAAASVVALATALASLVTVSLAAAAVLWTVSAALTAAFDICCIVDLSEVPPMEVPSSDLPQPEARANTPESANAATICVVFIILNW